MPTTYVEPLPHLRGRLNYVVYGSGPEGTKNRREHNAVRPLAQWCSFASIEQMGTYARKVRERFGNRKYEGHEIRVSWSLEELNPESEEDVLRAMEFGHALVGELFPESPYSIVAHGDGVGGCLHLHIDIVNVTDTTTCRAIRGFGRTNWQVKSVTDVLCRERQMRVVVPQAHAGAWDERRAELEAMIDTGQEQVGEDGKWTRAMRDATVALKVGTIVNEVITSEARSIHSADDFERALGERGVGINRKQLPDGGEGWTYTVECELEGKNRRRRCKASRVLQDFSSTHIMDTIAQEAERQRQAEEAQAAEQEALAQACRDAAEHKRREERRRRRPSAGTSTMPRPYGTPPTLEELQARNDAKKTDKARAEEQARERARKEQEARKAAEQERERREADARRQREMWARAVTVTDNPVRGPVVTVNSALIGAEDSPWQIRIDPGQAEFFAGTALKELPSSADDGLRRELMLWSEGRVVDPTRGTPARQVADSVAMAMRDGMEGRWQGCEMPHERLSGFAAGFDMAMRASGRQNRVNALQVVTGMYSQFCETIDMIGASVRDMARATLQRLGVIRAEQREGRTRAHESVDARTSFGRANQAAWNLDVTRDMPKAPERKQAEHGPAPEPEQIRDEPTPLSDLDLGGLRNFGE